MKDAEILQVIGRGKYPFSVTTFARLSQCLRVSPNRLLDGLPPVDEKRFLRITKALARKRQLAKQ